MIFNRSTSYAVQAVLYLGGFSKDRPISLFELSNKLNMPYHYLGKILQKLLKGEILDSKKGEKGGYFLSKHPDEIVLNDITSIFEGDNSINMCLLGKNECRDNVPCALHDHWKPAKTILINIFKNHTVYDWINNVNK